MAKKFSFRRCLVFLGLVFSLLLAFMMTGIVQAVIQNHKLSGDLIDEGDVSKFRISPDGRYVVFLADARTEGQVELFSVPSIGGDRVRLSAELTGMVSVVDFKISPDSQWVVYSVGSGCTTYQYFSVPIGGGTPVELYQVTGGDDYLSDVKISPDSSRVLFIHILDEIGTHREALLSIPISGGVISTISAPDDWCYIDYQITPDSQHVIYNQEESGCDFQGLYQNNLVGDDLIPLDDQHVEEFKITFDSTYVIFIQGTAEADRELFSIPIGGGGTEKLNRTLPLGGNVYQFQLSPNSEFVIYQADEWELMMMELYKVPVDGNADDRISITEWHMVPGGDVTSFRISPDSTWMVYRADQTVDGQFDLYSVPIEGTWGDGDPFKRLTKDMNPDGDVVEFRYEIAPNSAGVVLIADFSEENVNELFAVLKTGEGVRLNADLPPDGDVKDFRISNNSLAVVYRADQQEDEVWNLYLVPSIGGVLPVQINPDLVEDGDIGEPLYLYPFDITPDDKGVVYIADQEVDEKDELFITYDYQMVYLPMVVK